MIEERKIRLEWWKLIVGSIITIVVIIIPLIWNSINKSVDIPQFTLSSPIFTSKTKVNIYARNDIAHKEQNIHIEWDGFLFNSGAKISKNTQVKYSWEFIPKQLIKDKRLLNIGQHKVRFSFNNSNFSDYLQILLSEQSIVTLPKHSLGQIANLPNYPSVKRALIIGNSNYSKNLIPLLNPVNDAKLIAKKLKEAGFIVTVGLNLTKKEMEDMLNIYRKKIGRNDTSLIYFSGHGVQLEGEDYIVPIDANISDARDIKHYTIPIPKIIKINEKLKNQIILYSTSRGKLALDGNGRNSPFSSSLSKYITQPKVELSTAFHKVIEEVRKNTSGKQIPLFYSNASENIILNNKNSSIGQSASILIFDASRDRPFMMK